MVPLRLCSTGAVSGATAFGGCGSLTGVAEAAGTCGSSAVLVGWVGPAGRDVPQRQLALHAAGVGCGAEHADGKADAGAARPGAPASLLSFSLRRQARRELRARQSRT